MLTKLIIRNFKRFGVAEIALGSPVVFIGPNNSGKTSALQALALWGIGLRCWNEGRGVLLKSPDATVNRRDLFAIPVPDSNLLWHGMKVRNTVSVAKEEESNARINIRIEETGEVRSWNWKTSKVYLDIVVEGITEGQTWKCGLEFEYANPESFYCRPLRGDNGKRMPVPPEASSMQIAFFPPMSGLSTTETRLDDGAMNVRLGEGRTAEILRNLCFRVQNKSPDKWERIKSEIQNLFGAKLRDVRYIAERGEIAMKYQDYRGDRAPLDISSSGRGLQQTLLLLVYMYANPGAVLLLDEPDAHLEILQQRQIYKLITDFASDSGSQIIAASHSEVLLNEAADRDLVIAFVGKPHPIANRKSQVLKALREIGYEQYYQAEQTGWVLYLEGSTDFAVLQAFARRLGHSEATEALRQPFVHYVGNHPPAAERHYYGLREALPQLKGVALFDRLDSGAPEGGHMNFMQWNRREIENYLCTEEALMAYARASAPGGSPAPLSLEAGEEQRAKAMRASIGEISGAMETLRRGSPWSADAKVSNDFLEPLFSAYFEKLRLPNLMEKKSFYELAMFVPTGEIAPEIGEKLDAIARTAKAAKPRADGD